METTDASLDARVRKLERRATPRLLLAGLVGTLAGAAGAWLVLKTGSGPVTSDTFVLARGGVEFGRWETSGDVSSVLTMRSGSGDGMIELRSGGDSAALHLQGKTARLDLNALETSANLAAHAGDHWIDIIAIAGTLAKIGASSVRGPIVRGAEMSVTPETVDLRLNRGNTATLQTTVGGLHLHPEGAALELAHIPASQSGELGHHADVSAGSRTGAQLNLSGETGSVVLATPPTGPKLQVRDRKGAKVPLADGP